MRVFDIQSGFVYYDGKDGVRKIVSVDKASGEVRYLQLAARQEREWSSSEGKMVSTIGAESSCKVESFAVWAKSRFDVAGGDKLLLDLKAKKSKLSPGELAFMNSAKQEAGGEISPGTMIQIDHTEGRAVSGLAKKGFVIRDGSEAQVTELGAAWFRM